MKKPSIAESNNRHELFKDDDDDDKSTPIVTSEEIKIQKESKNMNNLKGKNKKIHVIIAMTNAKKILRWNKLFYLNTWKMQL